MSTLTSVRVQTSRSFDYKRVQHVGTMSEDGAIRTACGTQGDATSLYVLKADEWAGTCHRCVKMNAW
jgi:hypothetical protein